MSGAAEVLDQIIERYDKEGGSSGLRKHGEGAVDQISSMIPALHIIDAMPMIGFGDIVASLRREVISRITIYSACMATCTLLTVNRV
jgi:hypothetical protein